MKKFLILIFSLMVITGACLPVTPPVDSAPQVDIQATIDSIVNTAAAQTLAAQPSSTIAPPTETGTTVVQPSSTPDITDTPSPSPAPNLTTTPVTATSGTVDNSSITATITMSTSGTVTLTPTLGVITHGTLPPAVPFSDVYLTNESKLQAYITLQLCDTEAAGTILGYPVQNTVKIKAPLGNYIYVVWVGGRQITGELKVNKNVDLNINIFKDKIIIQ